LPKLFRQTVPQRWPGGGKTAECDSPSYLVMSAKQLDIDDDNDVCSNMVEYDICVSVCAL